MNFSKLLRGFASDASMKTYGTVIGFYINFRIPLIFE